MAFWKGYKQQQSRIWILDQKTILEHGSGSFLLLAILGLGILQDNNFKPCHGAVPQSSPQQNLGLALEKAE